MKSFKLVLLLIVTWSNHVFAEDETSKKSNEERQKIQVESTGTLTENVEVKDKKNPDKKINSQGDTFNFYFKKNEVSDKKGTSKQHKQVNKAKIDDLPIANLYLGLTVIPDGFSGGLLGAQFHFSNSFGFEAGIMTYSGEGEGSSIQESGVFDKDIQSSEVSGTGGFIGLSYLPLGRSYIGGLSTTVYTQVGVLFLSEKVENLYIEERGVFDRTEIIDSKTDSNFMGYVGLGVSAKISNNMTALGYTKLTSNLKYSLIGVGIGLSL